MATVLTALSQGRKTLPPVLIFLLQAPPAWGQEDGRSWRVETLERRFDARGRVAIRLANEFGELHVRSHEAPEITVYGSVQRHVDDPRRPELVIDGRQEALDLNVAYPDLEDGAPPPDAWRRRRIDLTVYVPRDARLHVRTLHERLRVLGHAAPVDAVSESGDVEVHAAAQVRIRSGYGKIWLKVIGDRLACSLETCRLETVTGEIRVDVPWDAAFRSTIETRGEIASDYSIDIAWLGGSRLKRGSVVAGEGGPAIAIRSEKGNVRLLRQVRPPGRDQRNDHAHPR